jgi:hypothetical protein
MWVETLRLRDVRNIRDAGDRAVAGDSTSSTEQRAGQDQRCSSGRPDRPRPLVPQRPTRGTMIQPRLRAGCARRRRRVERARGAGCAVELTGRERRFQLQRAGRCRRASIAAGSRWRCIRASACASIRGALRSARLSRPRRRRALAEPTTRPCAAFERGAAASAALRARTRDLESWDERFADARSRAARAARGLRGADSAARSRRLPPDGELYAGVRVSRPSRAARGSAHGSCKSCASCAAASWVPHAVLVGPQRDTVQLHDRRPRRRAGVLRTGAQPAAGADAGGARRVPRRARGRSGGAARRPGLRSWTTRAAARSVRASTSTGRRS